MHRGAVLLVTNSPVGPGQKGEAGIDPACEEDASGPDLSGQRPQEQSQARDKGLRRKHLHIIQHWGQLPPPAVSYWLCVSACRNERRLGTYVHIRATDRRQVQSRT